MAWARLLWWARWVLACARRCRSFSGTRRARQEPWSGWRNGFGHGDRDPEPDMAQRARCRPLAGPQPGLREPDPHLLTIPRTHIRSTMIRPRPCRGLRASLAERPWGLGASAILAPAPSRQSAYSGPQMRSGSTELAHTSRSRAMIPDAHSDSGKGALNSIV